MPSPFEYAKQFFKDNPQSLEGRTCANCDGNCPCKASKGTDNNNNNHDLKETGYKETNQE